MRSRVRPYLECLLVAVILALLPAAIYADYITPFEKWENWYWVGQPAPRPVFRGNELPLLLKGEAFVFNVLAFPPGVARASLLGLSTDYAMPWVSPLSSSEAGASLPPIALALEHLKWAIPVWMLLLVFLYEAMRVLRRFLPGRASGQVALAELGPREGS
jgi:hypothetical protein